MADVQDVGVYRLSDAAVRRILLRGGCWTPASLLYSLTVGLGLGLIGHAPLWPLITACALLTLLHLKSFKNIPRLKDAWRDFEVILEADRVLVQRRGALESSIRRSEITKVRALVEIK